MPDKPFVQIRKSKVVKRKYYSKVLSNELGILEMAEGKSKKEAKKNLLNILKGNLNWYKKAIKEVRNV